MNERSETNLAGVHPDLARVMRAASERIDLTVVEGVRSYERQRELVEAGKSWTMNSRHLTGHAVDIALFDGSGRYIKTLAEYAAAKKVIFQVAQELGVPLTWGGDWPGKRDGTHFQLTWRDYPLVGENQRLPENSKTIAAAVAGVPLAYLTDIVEAVGDYLGAIPAIDGAWIQGAQAVGVLAIAGFIIWERFSKLVREGT